MTLVCNATQQVECFLSCTASTCGAAIHCPNTTACNTCTVNCTADNACQHSQLYGYDCDTVIVNGAGNDNMKEMTIYSPKGDLYVNVLTGDDGFQKSTIIASPNSGKISLSCYDEDKKDECKEAVINGTHASHVELNCYGESNCNEMTINCPYYSVGTSCDINCEAKCDSMTIKARHGIPRTLEYNCSFSVCYLYFIMFIITTNLPFFSVRVCAGFCLIWCNW